MRRTMATAGRTVLFSSLTVAAALASLLVFPQRFLYSMGLGGALVALFAAPIALIVLPAVLALLGERVNALAPRFLQRPRRARRAARQRGLLVPALALRHAPPGPDRDRQRRLPDRARAPVPRRSSSPRSTPRCCRSRRQRPPGRRHAARRVPALPRHADPARGRRRRPPQARRRSPLRSPRARRRRGQSAAARSRGGALRDRRRSPTDPPLSDPSQDLVERLRDLPAGGAAASPAPPPTSSTSRHSLVDHLPIALGDRRRRRPSSSSS